VPEQFGLLNNFWWSNQRPNWGPVSNCYGDTEHLGGKMVPGLAPPVCMPLRVFQNPKTFEYPVCMSRKGLTRGINGEWFSTDPIMTQDFKGLISDIMKSLAASIFSGNGMVGLSLPIRIFQPMGTLEMIAETQSGYPFWINKANATADPVERMKFVICGMVAGLKLPLSFRKPFHPHLGETYAQTFADGTHLSMEQVSFDPPVTSYLGVKKGQWRWYGRYLHGVNLSTNSFSLDYVGPVTVEFSDKTTLMAFFPNFTSGGVTYGKRSLYYENKACFIYKQHRLKGYIHFGKVQKKPPSLKYPESLVKDRKDVFRGKIWKVDPKKFKDIRFGKEDVRENYKNVQECFNEKDIGQEISTFCGSFVETVEFDGVEYWNNETMDPPCHSSYDENPIPSDTRFREDLTW
jgi:hypothetical protein